MAQRIFHTVLVTVLCLTSEARTEISRGSDYFLIDGAKIPVGTLIEVSGPCLEMEFGARSHYTRGRAVVRGLRIDGRANQDGIQFHLCTSESPGKPSWKELDALKPGTHYNIRGRLMDGQTIGPRKAFSLVMDRVEAVPSAPLRFAEFLNRAATFEGTAASGGIIKANGEQAQVDTLCAWPESIEGKDVSVRGTLRSSQTGLRIEGATWKLIKLEDQIGRNVSLDGYLSCSNFDWWFTYRGTEIYLTTAQGPPATFDQNDCGRHVRVSGKLVRQDRPSLVGIGWESSPALVPCFVVRSASVEYFEEESTWDEKFGPIYSTVHSVRDGVPELLAERCFLGNSQFNRATAALYARRNRDVIRAILDEMTPKTREVLARRIDDARLPEPIRLLYAAMLASANDERGRSFLIAAIRKHDAETFPDALYCLGAFPTLASKQARAKTDVRWAEETLIALMTDRRPVKVGRFYGYSPNRFTATTAGAAVLYSDIPSVLLSINSTPARQVLVDYAIANHTGNSAVVPVLDVLLDSDLLIPVDDLVRLEPLTKGRWERRNTILSRFLRQKQFDVVERFLDELESGYVYRVFHDQLSAELIVKLQSCIPRLTGVAKEKARILVVLGERDPVPTLIAMLKNSDWKNRKPVLDALARLKDRRAAAPVARILRKAPDNYFSADHTRFSDGAVQSALRAIARSKSPQAVGELIELLPVNLARFSTRSDRAGIQRTVAIHLIRLTGESFGVDAVAWRTWYRQQRVKETEP